MKTKEYITSYQWGVYRSNYEMSLTLEGAKQAVKRLKEMGRPGIAIVLRTTTTRKVYP